MQSFISFIKRKIFRDARERWNYNFKKGRWNGLRDPEEQRRLAVTADLVRQYKGVDLPKILEIGCGEGYFRQYLNREDFSEFIGTDLSDVAIAEAKKLFEDDKTHFIASDMHIYQPPKLYDFIIFNECVYYTPDVTALVKRFFPYLKSGGYFIISVHHNFKGHQQIWDKIMVITSKIDEKTVVNSYDTWDIRVLKPLFPY